MCAFELKHLRYFVTVSEYGSMRKAAAAIGVRESVVSRRIRDLENQIGVSLFNRRSNGVKLTIAGQHLLRRSRDVLENVSDIAREADLVGRSENGKIRIGILSSLASGFLSDLLHSYIENHPDVDIEFINGNPSDHVAMIRKLKLDIAFIFGKSNWSGCEIEELWSEQIFVALPQQHHLVGKDKVEWIDLKEERFIVSDVAPGRDVYAHIVQRLSDRGRHPEIHAQYVGRDNLFLLVALGRGLTLTSEAATAALFPGVSYRPIVGELLSYSAVWSHENDNPAFRRLLSLARSKVRSS